MLLHSPEHQCISTIDALKVLEQRIFKERLSHKGRRGFRKLDFPKNPDSLGVVLPLFSSSSCCCTLRHSVWALVLMPALLQRACRSWQAGS